MPLSALVIEDNKDRAHLHGMALEQFGVSTLDNPRHIVHLGADCASRSPLMMWWTAPPPASRCATLRGLFENGKCRLLAQPGP